MRKKLTEPERQKRLAECVVAIQENCKKIHENQAKINALKHQLNDLVRQKRRVKKRDKQRVGITQHETNGAES
jgi:hypothetical protein